MNEDYDVIVLGTGLKECVLSGLLSVNGKKVLHMDRNDHYGGASASITPLSDLFKRFGKSEEYVDGMCGKAQDWNVDLIPKLIMANGELVKILILSGVTRYLEFKSVEGSYVYYKKKIHKIPACESEALRTDLVSMWSKKSFSNFVKFVIEYNPEEPVKKKDFSKDMTTEALFKIFGMTDVTDVIGHAIALHLDDDYLQRPCEETIYRLKLYFDCVQRYGKSPYLYPLYGLGELPQGFARLSAIYGGTYMLSKPIQKVIIGEDGKVEGVQSQDEVARAKMVIGDPSYFPDLAKKNGQVVRTICILDHPIMGPKNSSLGLSTQLIFPCSQVEGRKSDIYVCCVSHAHKVAYCSKDVKYYIAIASCKVETNSPEDELEPALKFLEPIKYKFTKVEDLYEPINDGKENGIFITKSYDATTHFETCCQDIKDVYERATGLPIDFSKVKLDVNVGQE
ncbi:rab GDP dissociation inhibitor alpha-like [Asterias rubens]|uniref:rab GDP dissociation inhibitor alpha-like n=1 Tax=Asterias rubens TaxID=7604 RepID=UPI001455AB58|nr:rab GDP dissociation inhibitor alpha-like [Asterias rubens]